MGRITIGKSSKESRLCKGCIRGIPLKKALVNKKAPPFLCDKNKEGGGFLIIHLEKNFFGGFFLTCKTPWKILVLDCKIAPKRCKKLKIFRLRR